MSPTDRPANPFTAPLEKMRHELDSLLEAAWANGGRALDAMGIKPGKSWAPEADVVESEEFVTVLMDLPGLDPQAVDITLAGNMLTVKGTRLGPVAEAAGTVHLTERPRGSFSRSIPLPVPVNPESVHAESRHGTLSIRLAKQVSAKPRHIRVQVTGPASVVSEGIPSM